MVALAVAAIVPVTGLGDARAPDQLAPTLGYTSLVRVEGAPVKLHGGRVDVWLQGDHATLRARLATSAGYYQSRYSITAGIGFPSAGEPWRDAPAPWPGSPQPGRFPVLLVQGKDLSRSERTLLFDAPPDATGPLGPVDLPRFGFDEKPKGWVHRWDAGYDFGRLDVVWTVPYAGDTYHGGGALDCSCGETYNFTISSTYVAIDPSALGFTGGEKVELVVHDALPVSVEALSFDGKRTLARIPAGGEWRTLLDPTRGGEPFVVSFLDGWRPGLPARRGDRDWWPSRIEASCASPVQENGEDMPSEDERRPWDLECSATVGARRSKETVTVPPFLRPAFSHYSGRQWFAAASYRKALQRAAPKVDGWPALGPFPPVKIPGEPDRGPAPVRVDPKGYKVTAPVTLPGGRHDVSNLSDGDPDTSWCAPAPGVGRKLVVEFPRPIANATFHLLPGLVRTPALYEANAVPSAVRVTCEPSDPARGSPAGLPPQPIPYLAVPDLYREGVVLPLAGSCSGRRATIEIVEVAAGRFSGDVCFSELVVLAPR